MSNYRNRKNNAPDELDFRPMEVTVNNGNFEDAFRRFKTMVQADGILADFKQSKVYEKPSEKKRRKQREAANYRLMVASREAMIASGEWEKRQKRKEQKRQQKAEERRQQVSAKQAEESGS